jgi:hypothetical protein
MSPTFQSKEQAVPSWWLWHHRKRPPDSGIHLSVAVVESLCRPVRDVGDPEQRPAEALYHRRLSLNVLLKEDTPVSGLTVVITRLRFGRSGKVELEDWPPASSMVTHTITRRTGDISLLPFILPSVVSTMNSYMFHLGSPLLFIRYAVYS